MDQPVNNDNVDNNCVGYKSTRKNVSQNPITLRTPTRMFLKLIVIC